MATSEPAGKIEIVAPVAQSQSQPPLELPTENPAEQISPIPLLDTSDSTTHENKSLSSSETSVNLSSPKKWGLTTSNSERPLGVSAAMEDEHKLQGVISVSLEERPVGSTTEYITPHQRPEIPALESVPAVVQGAESSVTTSEPSSTLGAPVEIATISTSEHDLPQVTLPTTSGKMDFTCRSGEFT